MSFKWRKTAITVLAAISTSWIIQQPGSSDVPPDNNPVLSESLCLTVLEDALKKGRSSNWNLSEQDRKILLQCRSQFYSSPNNAPLPTASQCIAVSQTLMQQGLDKLVELNISEAQSRSLQKCGEVIKAYYIPSKAMLPTLQANDRIILDKTAYRTQTPRRGDIVAFQPTKALQQQNFKEVFIQRVIGLPGERVEVRNGTVYINRKPVKEAYIAERPQYQYGPVVIPTNSYFVLGDNRNNSYDSHYWGFVPRDLIVGKVVWRYYPLDRAGSLSQ